MARRAAADVRERVLETAETLFYAYGVRAVGMQQIIDHAGCGKNLLYREFPSKSDLVAAYLGQARQVWLRGIVGAAAGPDDAATRLMAVLRAMAGEVLAPNYRGCPFRNYLSEFSDYSDPAGEIALAYLRDTRALIDSLVAELGVSRPDELAERIWLIVEGLYTAAAHPGGARAASTAVSLVEQLVNSAE